MRLAVVIAALALMAVTLVHLRRGELGIRHEIQRLQTQEIFLRRTLWDQQIRLGYLTAPSEILRRAEEMSLNLDGPGQGLAEAETTESSLTPAQ